MANTKPTCSTPLAASAAGLDAKACTATSSSFARRIPLTMLPRALAERTGRPPPSYRRCYFAALDGALPALQHGGRWFVADEDLDAAAVALGMVDRSGPAPVPAA